MPRRTIPGIFAIEGGWSPRLTDEMSVRPLLELLEGVGRVRFIHRDVSTLEGLINMARKWPQRQYSRYPLGYFSFHGGPGYLLLGRRSITLEQLGEELRGACQGKTIYFGSCSALGIPRREAERFRRVTDAKVVAGYRRDVRWVESAAFDLLLFEALTYYRRADAVERWLRSEYHSLVSKLGFVMYYG